MGFSRTGMLTGVAAAAALLITAGAASAQTSRSQTRTIEVPAGATVIVIPAGGLPMALPQRDLDPAYFPAMPDPSAMFRQIDAMMTQMEQSFATPAFGGSGFANPAQTFQAAFPAGSGVSGVTIASFSDGSRTCTREITYRGTGAPIVHVSGNACSTMGIAPTEEPTPAAEPSYRTPTTIQPRAPRTYEVRNTVKPQIARKTYQMAYLND